MDAETAVQDNGQSPDGGAKRRQIMDGARTVFLSDGFDGASMNDIARVAGVSKGTLYVYFDSKEALFEALIREDRKSQVERIMSMSECDRQDPPALLRAFGGRLMELMTRPESIAHLRVVIAATGKFPKLGQAFYEAGPCYGVNRLAAELGRLTAEGRLRVAEPQRAAQQFIDMCKSSIFHAVLFGVVDRVSQTEIDASVAAAVEVFLRAYGA